MKHTINSTLFLFAILLVASITRLATATEGMVTQEELDLRKRFAVQGEQLKGLRTQLLIVKRQLLKDKDVLEAREAVLEAQKVYNALLEKKLKSSRQGGKITKELERLEKERKRTLILIKKLDETRKTKKK